MSSADASEFEMALAARAAEVEIMLDRLLTARAGPGEIVRPPRLLAAMRHGVLNGGKRMRPLLVMESAALFEADRQRCVAGRCGARMRALLFADP